MADPEMAPEHHVNDLRETVERVRRIFNDCKAGCPDPDADPEAIAKWEGSFMALRGLLLEELNPLLESWERGEPHWRSTEQMLAGEPVSRVRYVGSADAPTD